MNHLVALTLILGQGDLLDELGEKAPVPVTKTVAKTAAAPAPSDGKTAETPAETPASESQPPADSGEPKEEEKAEAEDTRPGWLQELDKMTEQGAIGFLRKGGVFMWPILFLGIVAAGVCIERYRSLAMLRVDSSGLRREVQTLLEDNKTREALDVCELQHGPVPAILAAGIRKLHVLRLLGHDPARVEEQVVKAMDDNGIHVVAALERHLPVLATVSNAAPMLGFLGTVAGMITSFADIVVGIERGDNIVVSAAEGISVALYTTCFGLIVGIPSFVAFNYFTAMINRFVLDVEESATELVETVTLHQTMGSDSETTTAVAG